MREITQPMRLFDFVFGRWFFRYRISTPAKVSYSSPPSVATTVPPRRIQQSGVATADGSPNAGMSEHIILATLPGQRLAP